MGCTMPGTGQLLRGSDRWSHSARERSSACAPKRRWRYAGSVRWHCRPFAGTSWSTHSAVDAEPEPGEFDGKGSNTWIAGFADSLIDAHGAAVERARRKPEVACNLTATIEV